MQNDIEIGTVGQQLRMAREERGLTLRDLAAITRIQPSLLEYLESDRFDEMPAEVFARGFVRSCARELGLDADAVVEAYRAQRGLEAQTAVVVVSETTTNDAVTGSHDNRFFDPSRLGRVAYVAGLVALVVGLALSVVVFGGDSDTDTSTATWQPLDDGDAWRPAPEGQDDWRTYREN